MNKKEIEEIVSNKLTNDLNFNEMQIRHETITDITNECGTIQPCIIAMQPVVDWFNSKKLWTKLRREQEPYAMSCANTHPFMGGMIAGCHPRAGD